MISSVRREQENLNELDLLRSAFDAFPEAVIACDAKGSVLLMNRAATQLYGSSRINGPAADFPNGFGVYHADGKSPLQAKELPLSRALRGDMVQEIELIIKPVGSKAVHRVFASANQLYDDVGNLIGAVVVTRRKR